ncbi:flavoprotein [Streptomyces sp. NBC_01498]|uniref:flavoprotein n=1 Tax=Streptomyces sp. NBC_01498 TaxID=2975870 RepID=UPI002E7BA4E4|nr:flavoprotein [Streptomyces sp. NBC_01498]WTL25501.1 flavoprotein [Streptomyces sp. NBC_01498]
MSEARTPRGVLGVVASAAGGAADLRTGLVEPALARGWQVAVTLTPTAGQWFRASGEWDRLETLTGLPVRDRPRLPSEPRPHPPVTCYVAAPATANTVAKLALGIADNQALTHLVEALGTPGLPVIVFPHVNAAHARHPAWPAHLAQLRLAGVRLIEGPELWPLQEPDANPPPRELPWRAILDAAEAGIAD